MATAESQLTDWFTYLNQFKTCCSKINSDTDALNLQQFSDTSVDTLLLTPTDKAQFAVCCSAATALPVTSGAMGGASTFLALLESVWAFPDEYIAAYIQSLSPTPFNKMNLDEFVLQKTAAIYPTCTDPNWAAANTGLAGIMGTACYSVMQQTKVAALIADAAKTISDVIKQIVVFG